MSKNSNLLEPFSAEDFRKTGHHVVDILADYLAKSVSGEQMPVLPWTDPDTLVEEFRFDSCGGRDEAPESFIGRIIEKSIHIHHPNYIGHQVTSPLPLTAIVQFCTTLLNNGSAVYEMGPASMAMEKNVINKFGSLIGYPKGFDGIFTHGGTAGNLTAMLAVRQAKTDYNIWEEGAREGQWPGYIVTDHSHYSIGRNARILGLGSRSVITTPHDGDFRMNTGLLEETKKKAEDAGIKPICVAASACSTATGSYDDLDAIGDFCEKHGLWMHVDGAHGMGVLFSGKYRHLVKGIERADSVVIDFHKMLLVPALNTLVMFRNGNSSYETFAQKASYLFQKSLPNTWYNSAIRTIECTKSSLGTVAYTSMKYFSDQYYRRYIDSRYDLASEFAKLVGSTRDMELATWPMANIVCFRYSPPGTDESRANVINMHIRKTIIESGSFYIVQTELEGKTYLRVTIINPATGIDELKNLLAEVTRIGSTGHT